MERWNLAKIQFFRHFLTFPRQVEDEREGVTLGPIGKVFLVIINTIR